MKVAFIGGGKMAEAILHGVLSGKLADPEDISVGEPVSERREYFCLLYTSPSPRD